MGSAPPLDTGDRLFQALFENALDAILILDDERRHVDANPAACTLFGLSRDDLLGHRLDEFLTPVEAARLDSRWSLFLERGTGKGEMQILRPGGASRAVEVTSRAHFLPGRHLSMMRDITEQKVAEEALRASEERFFIAFNANPQPMSISSLEDGTYLEVNDSFLEATGYTQDELIGKTVVESHVWARSKDWDEILWRVGAEGSVRDFETTLAAREGMVREVLVAAESIDLDGERCVLVTATNITERKRLQNELLQSQRLESVGRLAGGVAHDFNNLLTVISGYSDLALRRAAGDEQLTRDIEEIRRAGERAAQLTRQLLAYSRKQLLRPKILDLNVAVAEMSKMLVRLIGEDIELVVRLDPTLGRVKADPGQIEQVIANLAVNARDAMPGGGRLTIETMNVALDETYARLHVDAHAGAYTVLSVSDTGVGMDPQTLEQIFEPFFTTKEAGRGTGLGLSTVYGIVRQSGGLIDVTSGTGEGTRFRIYLPRVDEALEVEPSAAPKDAPRGTETVLVVEDQPEVRRLIAETLAEHGYTVIEASAGDEAIEIVESGRPIQLTVTDVVMPRMSGRQMAERIESIRPDIRILYISGYSESAIAQHGVLEEGIAFLPKPFSPDDLARKVREVLDGGQ